MAYNDEEGAAVAAAVAADRFDAAVSSAEHVVEVKGVAPYQPGEFYKRELPCLQAVIAQAAGGDFVYVVDGYVFLDDGGRPGLGFRLHEATGRPVVGVAKSAFAGSQHARQVLRGTSKKALWVTAAGVDVDDAALCVGRMAGPDRLPLLIKRADALCRRRA